MSDAQGELLPCPFCGNENPEIEDHRLLWCISCACGVTVLGDKAVEPDGSEPAFYWDSLKGSAIGRWNSRVTKVQVQSSDVVNLDAARWRFWRLRERFMARPPEYRQMFEFEPMFAGIMFGVDDGVNADMITDQAIADQQPDTPSKELK